MKFYQNIVQRQQLLRYQAMVITFVQAYVTKPVARSGLNLLKDWNVSEIIIKNFKGI